MRQQDPVSLTTMGSLRRAERADEIFRKRSDRRLSLTVWLQREEQQSRFLMTGAKCLFPQLILVYLEPQAARNALISDRFPWTLFPSQVNKSRPDRSRDGRGRRRR